MGERNDSCERWQVKRQGRTEFWDQDMEAWQQDEEMWLQEGQAIKPRGGKGERKEETGVGTRHDATMTYCEQEMQKWGEGDQSSQEKGRQENETWEKHGEGNEEREGKAQMATEI